MNLGYQKVTDFSTDDLPLVITNNKLIFGFKTSPNYQTVIDLQKLTTFGSDDPELIRLAAESLVYVQIPDGARYDLSTVESIEVFIEETDIEFLRSIIVSWFVTAYARIDQDKKKLRGYLQPSTTNGSKSTLVAES